MSFDVQTGLASANGYRLFSLDIASGTLTVAPEAHLTKAFDELNTSSLRSQLDIACTIRGHYEWQTGQTLKPVEGKIKIRVEDDICWKLTRESGRWWKILRTFGKVASDGSCRARCRESTSAASLPCREMAASSWPPAACQKQTTAWSSTEI